MPHLMPVTEELAAALEARLAGSKFRSTEFFIDFYNSDLLNKGAEEVAEVAQAVEATFKNVKLQGKHLKFISESEVYLSEVREELHLWGILLRVKSRLRELVEEGTLERTAEVEFSPEQVGVLEHRTEAEGGEVHRTRLADEKFFKPADEEAMRLAHRRYSSVGVDLRFAVEDFLQLDDGFISDVWELTVRD